MLSGGGGHLLLVCRQLEFRLVEGMSYLLVLVVLPVAEVADEDLPGAVVEEVALCFLVEQGGETHHAVVERGEMTQLFSVVDVAILAAHCG